MLRVEQRIEAVLADAGWLAVDGRWEDVTAEELAGEMVTAMPEVGR